jgi:hypothetical protein
MHVKNSATLLINGYILVFVSTDRGIGTGRNEEEMRINIIS